MKQFENIHFTKIAHDELATVFGVLSLPQIFVYNAEGKLLRLFAGETPVDKILSDAK